MLCRSMGYEHDDACGRGWSRYWVWSKSRVDDTAASADVDFVELCL